MTNKNKIILGLGSLPLIASNCFAQATYDTSAAVNGIAASAGTLFDTVMPIAVAVVTAGVLFSVLKIVKKR